MKNKVYKERLMVFFLMQLILLILIVVYWVGEKWGMLKGYSLSMYTEYILLATILLSGVLGLVGIYILKDFFLMVEKEKELEIQNIKLKQIEEANQLLHSQRHDFLNNIQVVGGLLQLGSPERALAYLKEITGNLQINQKEAVKISKLNSPYLYTLFLNKLHECKEFDIEIVYDIDDNVDLDEYRPIDLVRIAGNLLDNAVYEVRALAKEQRKIRVSIGEDIGELVLQVHNTGRIISKDIQKNIFNPGFTTKKGEGTGMGLYNVKNCVQKYKGKVELISEEGIGTYFIIRLPIKNRSKSI